MLLNGEEHLRVRKLLMPLVPGSRLKRWEGFLECRTREEIAQWPVGTPFAIRPIADRITLDVLERIVFGMRDTTRGQELRELLPKLYDMHVAVAFGFGHPIGRLDLGRWIPWGAMAHS